jgi:D-alanyl-D-alanine carboxypeptidase
MLRRKADSRRAMRAAALSLATLMVMLAVGNADARTRHRHTRAAPVARYEPPYASIVVDANSGAVLESTNPDSPRHPASLTKIMTLYLLFERLDSGKIKPTTELSVSEHASEQAPSKLGLKPGETINVENAIRSIVTKSANDVAVIVAEALGGSEPEFARLMTKKAHELGMAHTTYVNASGLPSDEQITTARDQALLGRAIQDRFPIYYAYFQTRAFVFRGHAIRNHNKLLGAVDGVDGIKTGYTNASGFNLVTSVRRDGRHIVAAVFGGRTAGSRDARMRDLIGQYIRVAARAKTSPSLDAVAALKTDADKPAEKKTTGAMVQTASAMPMQVSMPATTVGSSEPIKPTAVKTFKVKAGTMRNLGIAGLDGTPGRLQPPGARAAKVTNIATVKSDVPPLPPGNKPGVLGVLPAEAAAAHNSVPEPVTVRRGGWIIQVGAFDDEADARQRLTMARGKARDVLETADPFTERVAKGDKTLYRARFAGFDKEQAETACKSLRRGEIPCMPMKN